MIVATSDNHSALFISLNAENMFLCKMSVVIRCMETR